MGAKTLILDKRVRRVGSDCTKVYQFFLEDDLDLASPVGVSPSGPLFAIVLPALLAPKKSDVGAIE